MKKYLLPGFNKVSLFLYIIKKKKKIICAFDLNSPNAVNQFDAQSQFPKASTLSMSCS